MNAQEYLQKKKEIQNALLEYVDKEDSIEEYNSNIIGIISDQDISNNCYELKLFLHLIVTISNYHHRHSNFFPKIEKILIIFEKKIKEFYSNSEIFKIFKSNKRILLFLFEKEILKFDKHIAEKMASPKYYKRNYVHYFYTEIKTFLSESSQDVISKEILENFEENRKIGENHNHICKLIRNDLIDEFISYVNLKNIPLQTNIENSIFETNLGLFDSYISLIEYAAFHGSTQIFKYLYLNNVKITDLTCHYSIFGNDAELFNIINENHLSKFQPIDKYSYIFSMLLYNSIMAHHNDMANYILTNFIYGIESFDKEIEYSKSIHFYNFAFLPENLEEKKIHFQLIKYDYFTLFSILLKNEILNINETNDKNIFIIISYISFTIRS